MEIRNLILVKLCVGLSFKYLLSFDFFFVKTWDEQHSVKNKSLHMRSMNSLRKLGNHGLQNLVKSRWWKIGPLTQHSNSLWPIYFCKLMRCLRKNENLIAWKIGKHQDFVFKQVLNTSSSSIYFCNLKHFKLHMSDLGYWFDH